MVLAVWLLVAGLAVLRPQRARAQDQEPIAAVGHGAFFDQSGRQIPVTLGFVTSAQAWYRTRLLADLSAQKKRDFETYDRRLRAGLNVEAQDLLVLQQQSLDWLLANASPALRTQIGGKLSALRQALGWKLPEQDDLTVPDRREPFTARPEVLRRLQSPDVRLPRARPQALRPAGGLHVLSATINSGQAYLNECMADGVPIPPPINVLNPNGTSGWKSQGLIPQGDQFIVGTPAEVRTYHSTSPEGMCFALPRFSDASLSVATLDGVICLGQQSSKVCFWDNQWTNPNTGNVEPFNIPAGTQIPIGVPSMPGGKYQAGGKEIELASGGVCTRCHAGENPYIIHPDSVLAPTGGGTGVTWGSISRPPQNLPTMSINRYDPLVAASWPQNESSQAGSTVPAPCDGCHFKGSAGRFPHLSNQTSTYCGTILAQAIMKTMPPGAHGSAAAVANAFKDMWCNFPPNSSSEDTGDPHITTMNAIHYDFQAAGEFTALRNSDTGFELQTRQTPVLTDFTPGANDYTGLASCVSLNTAVAMRLGKRRVSYQPYGASATTERLQLRVDGEPTRLTKRLDLGGGNVLSSTAVNGEIDVRAADGTRVVVTPLFWTSQGYWYLDVQVFSSPAREGVAGPVIPPDWLPRAPDGASFGPRPASLLDRHVALNHKFADAWRVKSSTSLFDYSAGTTTADFTDANWPPESGQPCTSTTVHGKLPRVKEPRPELAERACRGITDKGKYANCIFDVTVMADASAANGYRRAYRPYGTSR